MTTFFGVPPSEVRRGVGDRLERVGAAHVGGQAVVGEVEDAGDRVVDHVLDDGAELRGGRVDLGLGLGREVDGLGVAAALEVEGAVVGPAVLVVADQHPLRVGRERGLAGARQAEEQRHVVGVAAAVVGRAVHRHHALLGKQVVEDAEDALLVLAGVGGAADQDQPLLEGDGDHRLGAAAVPGRVGLEARAVEDGEAGHEAGELGRLRAAQHVADEEAVPGELGDHPDVQPVGRIGAGVEVLHEELGPLDMGAHVGEQPAEVLRRHRRVVLPPDVRHDRGLADDELVLRAAAGVPAGGDEERAADAELALAARDGGLHQRRLEEVVVHRCGTRESRVASSVIRGFTLPCTLNTVVIGRQSPFSGRATGGSLSRSRAAAVQHASTLYCITREQAVSFGEWVNARSDRRETARPGVASCWDPCSVAFALHRRERDRPRWVDRANH